LSVLYAVFKKMLLEPKLWDPPWIQLEEFRALPDSPSRYKVTNRKPLW